jgi:hypothetical protein
MSTSPTSTPEIREMETQMAEGDSPRSQTPPSQGLYRHSWGLYLCGTIFKNVMSRVGDLGLLIQV